VAQSVKLALKTSERMTNEIDAILAYLVPYGIEIVNKRLHREQFGLFVTG